MFSFASKLPDISIDRRTFFFCGLSRGENRSLFPARRDQGCSFSPCHILTDWSLLNAGCNISTPLFQRIFVVYISINVIIYIDEYFLNIYKQQSATGFLQSSWVSSLQWYHRTKMEGCPLAIAGFSLAGSETIRSADRPFPWDRPKFRGS